MIEKYWGGCGHKWLWPQWSQGGWMNDGQTELIFHADVNSRISSFSNTPTLLNFQSENIDPEGIANIFNNYFSTISEKTQAKIKHSYKKSTDYLSNENPDTFFLSPTNKEEIKFIPLS